VRLPPIAEQEIIVASIGFLRSWSSQITSRREDSEPIRRLILAQLAA
jgi:hypothetical protein